jgi:anti-sigma regulatory factor (Ser/Thr protein kinase)
VAPLIPTEHRRHPINAFEDVGALRRAIAKLAASHRGLRAGEAELVATELGTNLVRHADPGGYVLYRSIAGGVEMLSVDTGPGMGGRSALADTSSAARQIPGGLSAGLGVIGRIATTFDTYSSPQGTVLLARLETTPPKRMERWRFGGVNIPLGGEGASGDGWSAAVREYVTAFVVDGLGHGEEAGEAARAAVERFEHMPVIDPVEFLGRAHESMRGTRGGVAAVCVIEPNSGQVTFAGLGNITGEIISRSGKQYLSSHPGTLGTQLTMPKTRLQQYKWPAGGTLIMCSDGIRAGWGMSAYPGLIGHDPAVIAAVLHRDFSRGTDDATVLVVRDVS